MSSIEKLYLNKYVIQNYQKYYLYIILYRYKNLKNNVLIIKVQILDFECSKKY